jgi:hypothetical protein
MASMTTIVLGENCVSSVLYTLFARLGQKTQMAIRRHTALACNVCVLQLPDNLFCQIACSSLGSCFIVQMVSKSSQRKASGIALLQKPRTA